MIMFGIQTVRRILAQRKTREKEGILDRPLGNVFQYLGLNKRRLHALDPSEVLYLSAAWRCVNVISGSIAVLPWSVMEKLPDGKRQESPYHPINKLLDREPNKQLTAYSLRETAITHVLLYGNAYMEIVRDSNKVARQLHIIRPDRVTPRLSDMNNGELYYEVTSDYGNESVYLTSEDMFHVPGLSFDGRQGYSILDVAKVSVDSGLNVEDFSSSYFKNALTPTGVVKLPPDKKVTPEGIQNLMTTYIQSQKGMMGHHLPFVVAEGMEYQPVSNTPEDSQMIETRQFNVHEVCRWFGVPPFLVYAMNEPLRASVEAMTREFKQFTLMPIIRKFEAEANRKLLSRPNRFYTRIDTREFTSANLEMRTDFYKEMRNMGVFTVNEIRAMEGLSDIGKEGDHRVMQVQWQPIDKETGAPTLPVENNEPGDTGETGETGSTETNPMEDNNND